MPQTETMVLNLGPQHPSTHGVLRVVLELDGELIVKADPDIGYLHRGIEKMCEFRTYHQCLPLTDRIDYLAGSANNLGFVLAVEKLLGVEVPKRTQYIRVMIAEMTRISSHLFWLGTHGHDLGAMTPLFYAFREREKLMDLFEMVWGGRLFPCYFRIGGLAADLPEGFTDKVWEFVETFPKKIEDYENLLTYNRIWIARTKGVGVMTPDEVLDWGWSGPMARGSGVDWDLRRDNPYSSYEDFDFVVPLGKNGDTYDRYLVRMEEMRQSNRIIRQVLENLPAGDINVADPRIALPPKERVYNNIEALINHFLIIEEGIKPPVGEVYQAIEAPKGELGFYIVSDGSVHPLRVKIRAPSFVNLAALGKLAQGRLLADLIALIGTMDIVLADVDR
ncbi:MAG: NADH dehydrogenase (quinone) subunit D [Deltaproteobacteria bacterium]|nr:NADH dehydrogenase (quinone) subunit D [Deltaproteobacteria bacterium]MBW1951638.1 NADH dehydrogenase (quinone) subunit D [Deltaproteobacteria bacterium]MBW1985738.1 NADH dehydrogenase (quinone) subunit D [Deltaproteobacteria bacterium]MBW2134651.1 NADH dehydrogenase (quinone) subunit D [Deltaproteobacteria bacterium]